jgi:pantetheine-phosphate adenylyltransferase
MKKIALFPGSFDPFTLGHYAVVGRGLELVDEIVIAIGLNEKKATWFSPAERLAMIRRMYRGEERVRVEAYDSLTVDFAGKTGARFILRGVRTACDFEYEKNLADINRKLAGVETFILFAEPEHAHISSSLVRELLRYGKDISPFLPQMKD